MMSNLMRNNKMVLVLLVLLAALLVACGSGGTTEGGGATDGSDTLDGSGSTEGEGTTGGDQDAATAAATAHLAAELGIGEDEIQVISAHETEFTDSCLGLGRLDESCLQAMTPGWIVVLDAGGQTYELHTDVTGEQVRMVEAME